MGKRGSTRNRWLVAISGAACAVAVVVAIAEKGVWQRSQSPQSESWQVVRVSDGDTIKVQSGEQRETIRLCGIDAPEVAHGNEPGQPFAREATEKLRSLLASANNQVIVVPVEKDRYGRIVGEVFVKAPTREQPEQERYINYEMVASGLAYEYTRYSGSCPNREAIAQSERLARSKHLGVWGGNYQRPWDYRRQQRETSGFW